MRKALLNACLALYAEFLVQVTLRMFGSPDPGHNAVPFRTMRHDWSVGGASFVINFVGNVAVFVPLGAILAMRWPRGRNFPGVVLACLAISGMIEAMQFRSGCRVADVDDVILNGVGGALGGLLARVAGLEKDCRLPDRPRIG